MLSLYGRGILQQRVLLSELVWKVRCRCGPSVVSNITSTPLCDSLGCVHPHNEGLHSGLLSRRGPSVRPAPLTCHRSSLLSLVWFLSLSLSFSHATSLHVFCWLFLCLVHAGVPTSLNSVARLLLNAVYRLLLNVTDASLSFLPGTSRTSCTSEPAWRLSGPCASASNCYSAGTHQHLLDLTVASTAPSESSAPVFPLCILHGVLLTPLATLALSEYRLLYPSNRRHVSLWLDNVSFHLYMRLGPVLVPALSVCRQITSTSTFMPVYCCCETSTVCGAFWLFMTMYCTCVL